MELCSAASATPEKNSDLGAEVPVTSQAAARGLVNPKLRIKGEYDSEASCGKLEELMASIRF